MQTLQFFRVTDGDLKEAVSNQVWLVLFNTFPAYWNSSVPLTTFIEIWYTSDKICQECEFNVFSSFMNIAYTWLLLMNLV